MNKNMLFYFFFVLDFYFFLEFLSIIFMLLIFVKSADTPLSEERSLKTLSLDMPQATRIFHELFIVRFYIIFFIYLNGLSY